MNAKNYEKALMTMAPTKKTKKIRPVFRKKSAAAPLPKKEDHLCPKHAGWQKSLKDLKKYAGAETSIYIEGVASRARILPTEQERLDFAALAVKTSIGFGIKKNHRNAFLRKIIRDIQADFPPGTPEAGLG